MSIASDAFAQGLAALATVSPDLKARCQCGAKQFDALRTGQQTQPGRAESLGNMPGVSFVLRWVTADGPPTMPEDQRIAVWESGAWVPYRIVSWAPLSASTVAQIGDKL